VSNQTLEQINQLLQLVRARGPVYLVGAGGCGMSGLGHLLLDLGFAVAGSDLVRNEEVRGLLQRGALIYLGHDSTHVQTVQPFLVVYSSAIGASNPERIEAEKNQLPCVHRSLLLAALMQRQRGICVAGMHGKTTTAAWLAFALEQLQQHPSYAVGALVPQLNPHARFSFHPDPATRPWFVAETDESDGSLCAFAPEHAIMLNIDEEHLDHYDDLDHIGRVFQEFATRTRSKVIYCADDHRLAQLLSGRSESCSYGFGSSADYVISRAEHQPAGQFNLRYRETDLGEFNIQLLGDQNVSNAAAVVAMLHELGFARDPIALALQPFQGASRRQELVFEDARFRIFNDYGHHPREIAATIRALKTLGGRRLLVAFQPHRFTRTQHLLEQFASCFQGADQLWLTEIYAASEPAIPGVNGALLADAVRSAGQPVEYIASLDELGRAVRVAMRPGDVILFLGAGDITHAARELAQRLTDEQCAAPSAPLGAAGGDIDVYATLISLLSSQTVCRRQEPMAKHTTMRVGGPADLYLEPQSEADLGRVVRHCNFHHLPFLVIGRGSNLLISDEGFRGVVMRLAHPDFARIEAEGARLHAGAGARLKTVVLEAKRHSLGGFEFLEGIPGSLGGALSMNAGAMGASIFNIVESVRAMDYSGGIQDRTPEELAPVYRSCRSLQNLVVLSAVLRGEPTDRESIGHTLAAFSEKRWSSQPAAPSAGCVFRNPPSIPAGRLIEELGFKGTQVGGALVSEVHANFIVNTGSATARDVLTLIQQIQTRARTERGIELETEVIVIDPIRGRSASP
jgi:UDP-N-acetylmuramate--alanine ligase